MDLRYPTCVGHSRRFKHRNNPKISKQISQNWYVTNSDTLHHDLNVPYVRDEIKKLSQRYVDRLEERPNTVAIDLMSETETSRGSKRKLPQDLFKYTLRGFYKLSNVSPNITPVVTDCNDS